MDNLKIVCPCLFGLESILAGEMKRLSFREVKCENGKVSFVGDLNDIARANINLRTAERVQIEVASFKALSFEDLFQGTLNAPWEDFIDKLEAFPVKGWSLNSKLHSVPDCQSIIKKAVVKRLESKYGISYFEETASKVQIQFSILKDEVSLLIDTSGAGLHKRGYRANSNDAPIKETLAAGILDLARVKGDSVLYDAMCGSGTFLAEGFLRAMKIAPGLRRSFAVEKNAFMPQSAFQNARNEALEKIDKSVNFEGFGFDIDKNAIQLTDKNLSKIAAKGRVKTKIQDIKDFVVPEKAIVVCNPPYGERLLDIKNAEEIYKTMGKVFEKRDGVNYYIISPHEDFESFFGRKATKKRKLYNGMIKCNLYMYF